MFYAFPGEFWLRSGGLEPADIDDMPQSAAPGAVAGHREVGGDQALGESGVVVFAPDGEDPARVEGA
jgi:hypothetical protein